ALSADAAALLTLSPIDDAAALADSIAPVASVAAVVAAAADSPALVSDCLALVSETAALDSDVAARSACPFAASRADCAPASIPSNSERTKALVSSAAVVAAASAREA